MGQQGSAGGTQQVFRWQREGFCLYPGLSPLGAMVRSGKGKGGLREVDEMGWGTPRFVTAAVSASLGRSHRPVRAQGWRPPLVTLIQHAVAAHMSWVLTLG